MERIKHIRNQYTRSALDESHLDSDPFVQFEIWMNEALSAEIPEPNAMNLATVGLDGMPSGRIVLLRGVQDGGFVFYTNYCSRKGRELAENPMASVCFFWYELQRQIRIEGIIDKVASEMSDAYYKGRPRGSQLGAWASDQSDGITGRNVLEERLKELEVQFKDLEDIPRPEFWGGYMLKPIAFEFWQGRESRLHDRFRYEKHNGIWKVQRLAP